jgi:hypothetical protein
LLGRLSNVPDLVLLAFQKIIVFLKHIWRISKLVSFFALACFKARGTAQRYLLHNRSKGVELLDFQQLWTNTY